MQKAIAYYRVSTQRQGRSGLGLEAQQRSVESFAKANDLELFAEYFEVSSGKRNHRLALLNAISECRREKATLIIAKLDRLSRRVAFISMLLEADVKIMIVDHPDAETFVLHILAAIAEKERIDISKRTKDALAAAKQRGKELGKFGRYVLSKRNRKHAELFAKKMKPIIENIRLGGVKTVRAIMHELNRLNIPTFRKNTWHLNTVYQLIKRIDRQK